jgi:hypothetical protein
LASSGRGYAEVVAAVARPDEQDLDPVVMVRLGAAEDESAMSVITDSSTLHDFERAQVHRVGHLSRPSKGAREEIWWGPL